MSRKGFWWWGVIGAQRGGCRSVVEGRWRRFCEGKVFEHFVFFVSSQLICFESTYLYGAWRREGTVVFSFVFGLCSDVGYFLIRSCSQLIDGAVE